MSEQPPFENADTPSKVRANDTFNRIQELQENPDKNNIKEILELKEQLKQALWDAEYGGVNPKEIPTDTLIELTKSYFGEDTVERKYKERVRSPLTGIRSFCVVCQGGSVPSVRACPSANCPLWPFRMGNNPFFNMPGAEAETDEDIEDDGNQTPLVERNTE